MWVAFLSFLSEILIGPQVPPRPRLRLTLRLRLSVRVRVRVRDRVRVRARVRVRVRLAYPNRHRRDCSPSCRSRARSRRPLLSLASAKFASHEVPDPVPDMDPRTRLILRESHAAP